MKALIDVENRAEYERIHTALDDPLMRALINVAGSILPLEPRDRRRVLQIAEPIARDTRGETNGH